MFDVPPVPAAVGVRPSSAKVAPLVDERDRLPDGRVIYGLTLTYVVNVIKPGEITPDL